MKPRLLCLLDTAPELDYVDAFQRLATVHLQLERDGPSGGLLLRQAALELDVGNYAAALGAARQAVHLVPAQAEAHYLAATAAVMLACVRAKALPGGPGQDPQTAPARALVEGAARDLGNVVRLNPGDDEARTDLAALSGLLAHCLDEGSVCEVLRESIAELSN